MQIGSKVQKSALAQAAALEMINQSGFVNVSLGHEFAKPSFINPAKSANTVTIQQKQPNGTSAPTAGFNTSQAQSQATGTMQLSGSELVDSEGQQHTNGQLEEALPA